MTETTKTTLLAGQQTKLTKNGEQVLRVLESRSKGDLPMFVCEEIQNSIVALMIANGFLDKWKTAFMSVSTRTNSAIQDEDVLSLLSSILEDEPECRDSEIAATMTRLLISRETVIQEGINDIAESFLANLENTVHQLLCDEFNPERADRGFYLDWFDEAKITAAIRLVPSVLSTKWNGAYPIHWQTWKLQETSDEDATSYSLKSLSLVPMLAKLGAELGCRFRDEIEENNNDSYNNDSYLAMRGGLLSKDLDGLNVLQNLCLYPWVCFSHDEEHQKLCDETTSRTLQTLKEQQLLTKEDIRDHDLVWNLFCLSTTRGETDRRNHSYFPEQRFRFFSDWDPTTLATPIGGSVPLFGACTKSYDATKPRLPIHWSMGFSNESMRAFSIVLKAGMKHYPEKIGFVFANEDGPYSCGYRNSDNGTKMNRRRAKRRKRHNVPYFEACETYGAHRVKTEVLDRLTTTTAATDTNRSNDKQLSPEGFLLSAMTDETMDRSGLHLLLQHFSGALSQILTKNERISKRAALETISNTKVGQVQSK
ncbi:unnamed protein product [Pseudo-nitzschia multistriata]|uniref:Uncharacterized protein n=1 Tax=Pseudo-nitzschia multistriata TaxID=183589 RepID=A0A448ZLM1_9STRA|nr:unnamed protein product [Pseudo-nitzschia multistriata]